MLKKIIIERQVKTGDFLKFISAKDAKELFKRAKLLRGRRVIHVNAAEEGGVAEILKSLIPYLRSLGVESDWYVVDPKVGRKFFSFTNKLHNALQGAPTRFSAKEWAGYRNVSRKIAENLEGIDCNILAINDPQLLLAGSLVNGEKSKVYFSHIDTSNAYRPVWKKILRIIDDYGRVVFSNKKFIHESLPLSDVKIFTPAIDPLAAKQKIVPKMQARRYLGRYGIKDKGPLIIQISRFDIWKNPLGVTEAFRIVQGAYPDAQLALVGFNEAKDNPEAASVYKDIAAISKKSPDILLFFNPIGKNVLKFTVMAQNAADVVVQNSIKEGFGLTVTEAMWKRHPVVGGPALGIRAQIVNNSNGFITENSEELAEKISYLLSHPKQRKKMGEAAHRTVIKKFLFPRLVLDHLKIYNKIKA